VDADLRLNVLVEDFIIVELKAVEEITSVHETQLLAYLKLLQKPKGLLINFNCTNISKEGRRTIVNKYYPELHA
jgi:GxxExxY protein